VRAQLRLRLWLALPAVVPPLLGAATAATAADVPRPSVTFVRFAPGQGAPSLYSVTLPHGAPHRLRVPVAAAAGPAWSRDGRLLVFAGGTTLSGRADFTGPTRLWSVRPDGSHARALTSGSVRDGAAAWSPDTERIVFARAAGNRSSLWIVDRAGRHVRRLTRGSIDLEPSWAPGGRTIAFVRIDPSTFQSGIWLVRPDGTGLQRILSGWRGVTAPVWSADGTHLLVEDGRALYSTRPTGGGRRLLARLAHDPNGAFEDPAPAWSSDGTLVAFCQFRRGAAGASDIWVVRADGSGLRRLTHSPGLDTDPAWRP